MDIIDQIIEVLNELAEKFGIVIDWTSNNILPYLQEVCGKCVNYEIATSIIWGFMGVGIYLFFLKLCNILHKNKDFGVTKYDYLGDDTFMRYFMYGFLYVGIVIGTLITIFQTVDIVTCLIFPEKIIIEKLLPIIQ